MVPHAGALSGGVCSDACHEAEGLDVDQRAGRARPLLPLRLRPAVQAAVRRLADVTPAGLRGGTRAAREHAV